MEKRKFLALFLAMLMLLCVTFTNIDLNIYASDDADMDAIVSKNAILANIYIDDVTIPIGDGVLYVDENLTDLELYSEVVNACNELSWARELGVIAWLVRTGEFENKNYGKVTLEPVTVGNYIHYLVNLPDGEQVHSFSKAKIGDELILADEILDLDKLVWEKVRIENRGPLDLHSDYKWYEDMDKLPQKIKGNIFVIGTGEKHGSDVEDDSLNDKDEPDEEETPKVEEEESEAGGNIPDVPAETPKVEEEEPEAGGNIPEAPAETPKVEEEEPEAGGNIPEAPAETPKVEEEEPEVGEEIPDVPAEVPVPKEEETEPEEKIENSELPDCTEAYENTDVSVVENPTELIIENSEQASQLVETIAPSLAEPVKESTSPNGTLVNNLQHEETPVEVQNSAPIDESTEATDEEIDFNEDSEDYYEVYDEIVPLSNFMPEISETVNESFVDDEGNTFVRNTVFIGLDSIVINEDGAIELADNIVSEIANMLMNSNEVVLEMGDASVIPAKLFETAAGNDVSMVIVKTGYYWTINGQDIVKNQIIDINFEVIRDSYEIPVETASKKAKDKPSTQLSLAHNGNLGLKAYLTVELDEIGTKNVGKYANLYYYNKKGKLVFQNSGKITSDGNATLLFTHASEYLVVIGSDVSVKSKMPVVVSIVAINFAAIIAAAVSIIRKRKKYSEDINPLE